MSEAYEAPKPAPVEEGPLESEIIKAPRLGFIEESARVKMTNPEFTEVHKAAVYRVKDLEFKLTAGPLDPKSERSEGTPYFDEPDHDDGRFYVLAIDLKGAQEKLDKSLGFYKWGSNSSDAIAREAHRIALEFCKKNNFVPVIHINSWPDFKAVIHKFEPEPEFATEEEADEWRAEKMRALHEADMAEEEDTGDDKKG